MVRIIKIKNKVINILLLPLIGLMSLISLGSTSTANCDYDPSKWKHHTCTAMDKETAVALHDYYKAFYGDMLEAANQGATVFYNYPINNSLIDELSYKYLMSKHHLQAGDFYDPEINFIVRVNNLICEAPMVEYNCWHHRVDCLQNLKWSVVQQMYETVPLNGSLLTEYPTNMDYYTKAVNILRTTEYGGEMRHFRSWMDCEANHLAFTLESYIREMEFLGNSRRGRAALQHAEKGDPAMVNDSIDTFGTVSPHVLENLTSTQPYIDNILSQFSILT